MSVPNITARLLAVASATCLFNLSAFAQAGGGERLLTGDDLKSLVPGATINLDTPLGLVIPVTFSADGRMVGNAGVTLGAYLGGARDRGRWWIENSRLCQRWIVWFDAESKCSEIRLDGKKIAWRGNDGKTGTATLITEHDQKLAASGMERPTGLGIVTAMPPSEPETAPPLRDVPATEVAGRAGERGALVEASPTTRGGSQPVVSAKTAALVPVLKAPTSTSAAAAKVSPATAKPSLPVAKASVTASAWPSHGLRMQIMTYVIVGVAEDDRLNVRSEPSSTAPAVASLSPQTTGIRLIGACTGAWCPVAQGNVRGWVNRAYIALEAATADATQPAAKPAR